MGDDSVPAWKRTLPDLTDEEYRKWAQLLESRTGIGINQARKAFLESNLRQRMREVGYTSFDDYYNYLQSGGGGRVEWVRLVDRLTVHETRFRRHPASFEMIRTHFLPQSILDCGAKYRLHAWSVGCSTGEEAYTLAMLIDRHLNSIGCSHFYSITGTDVSLSSIATAKQARYHRSSLEGLPPSYVSAYFDPEEAGMYRVKEKIRERVCFVPLNIQELERAPLGKMDIIFCQNVLIYFEHDRRKEILAGLIGFLKKGGVLILGLGEVFGWSHPQLERVAYADTLAYVRTAD